VAEDGVEDDTQVIQRERCSACRGS
jgi:hypothetical protein